MLKRRVAARNDTTRASSRAKPVTVRDLVRAVAARLQRAKLAFAHGTTDPVAEAAFIVGEILKVHPDRIEALAARRVTAAQQQAIDDLVERRIATRKPAAYLLRRIYMRGVPFFIDERAIVPRSYIGEILDDELFESLVESDAVKTVLDLCTGSGCLTILAAMRFPNAKVDAADLSKDALAVARKNVALHRMQRRVRLVQGDLFAPLQRQALRPHHRQSALRRCEGNAEPAARVPARAGAGVRRRQGWHRDRAADHRAGGRHLTPAGGLFCEIGRCRPALERAYPKMRFLWLDTEESSGEVFWLDAKQLTGR